MSAWQEEACRFPCEGHVLIGVLCTPTQAPPTAGPGALTTPGTGVVIVVGGPQTRIGAHRRFVGLARALAGGGVPVLRFDLRGMGDSEGDPPGFEASGPDITAAMHALQARCPGVHRIVLWGLCDGASAAVLAWGQLRDQRVAGLCLVNPWVRTAGVQARTQVQQYYGSRLRDPVFWRKLLAGRIGFAAVAGWWKTWRRAREEPAATTDFTDAMASALQAFAGPVLLVLSGRDHTAREFEWLAQNGPHWRGLWHRPTWTRVDHAQADHTHSGDAAAAALESDVLRWLQQHFGPKSAHGSTR